VAPAGVMEAVNRFTDRITAETLANGIACGSDLPYKETFSIEKNEIGIALGKA